MFEWVFFILGGCCLADLAWFLALCLFGCFYRDKNSLTKGSWGLVTAATDGIGLGFAEELGRKGLNVVLVGRNHSKLAKLGQRLKESCKVEVVLITKDFEDCAEDPKIFFSDIFKQIEHIKLSVLVNNIGGGQVKYFLDNKKILSTLKFNIFSTVFMTRLYLEKLKKDQNQFAVINVSSVASIHPGVRLVTYRACKAFESVFSEILSCEVPSYQKFGYPGKVLCITPSLVDAPSTEGLRSKPFIISKNDCAENSLEMIGCFTSSSGHWKHQAMFILNSIISPLEPFLGRHFTKDFEID